MSHDSCVGVWAAVLFLVGPAGRGCPLQCMSSTHWGKGPAHHNLVFLSVPFDPTDWILVRDTARGYLLAWCHPPKRLEFPVYCWTLGEGVLVLAVQRAGRAGFISGAHQLTLSSGRLFPF